MSAQLVAVFSSSNRRLQQDSSAQALSSERLNDERFYELITLMIANILIIFIDSRCSL